MIGTEPDFNKQSQNGLIPAVIVDAETKAFLMLGYMNKESYSLTKSTGQTWFGLVNDKNCGIKGRLRVTYNRSLA